LPIMRLGAPGGQAKGSGEPSVKRIANYWHGGSTEEPIAQRRLVRLTLREIRGQ
jgi:hypothetical protein